MTPVERALLGLKPAIGDRWVERIRSNLPSRKPQLWEAPVRAVYRRLQRAVWSRLDPDWVQKKVVVRLRHPDLLMELSPGKQDIDLSILQFGIYEIAGTRFVEAFLRPGMVFVDVGANSGYYSLIASRLVGPTGRVCAMEPADVPFLKLLRNIEINGLKNVKTVQSAAGIADGRSLLYASAVGRNDGLGSLAPGPGRSALGREVRVVALETLVSEIPGGRVNLMKVDVEGAELEVLRGGGALLAATSAPALLFESFNVQPVFSFLRHLGYDVRQLHFSLAKGLEFPKIGEVFDNSFGAYEPPNFVALKTPDTARAFETLTARSKECTNAQLRLLASLA